MIDPPNLTPITRFQRQTLSRVLNTVANGGGASHSMGPDASTPNTTFHELLETLVDSGLLRRKERTIHDANQTGTLVLNYGAKDEISALADAAGSSLGDLRSELAALTSNDAVSARLEEIASAKRPSTSPSKASSTPTSRPSASSRQRKPSPPPSLTSATSSSPDSSSLEISSLVTMTTTRSPNP